jgi:hypothetical protein
MINASLIQRKGQSDICNIIVISLYFIGFLTLIIMYMFITHPETNFHTNAVLYFVQFTKFTPAFYAFLAHLS